MASTQQQSFKVDPVLFPADGEELQRGTRHSITSGETYLLNGAPVQGDWFKVVHVEGATDGIIDGNGIKLNGEDTLNIPSCATAFGSFDGVQWNVKLNQGRWFAV